MEQIDDDDLERLGRAAACDPDRFFEWGAWASPPERWEASPESRLLSGELTP